MLKSEDNSSSYIGAKKILNVASTIEGTLNQTQTGENFGEIKEVKDMIPEILKGVTSAPLKETLTKNGIEEEIEWMAMTGLSNNDVRKRELALQLYFAHFHPDLNRKDLDLQRLGVNEPILDSVHRQVLEKLEIKVSLSHSPSIDGIKSIIKLDESGALELIKKAKSLGLIYESPKIAQGLIKLHKVGALEIIKGNDNILRDCDEETLAENLCKLHEVGALETLKDNTDFGYIQYQGEEIGRVLRICNEGAAEMISKEGFSNFVRCEKSTNNIIKLYKAGMGKSFDSRDFHEIYRLNKHTDNTIKLYQAGVWNYIKKCNFSSTVFYGDERTTDAVIKLGNLRILELLPRHNGSYDLYSNLFMRVEEIIKHHNDGELESYLQENNFSER